MDPNTKDQREQPGTKSSSNQAEDGSHPNTESDSSSAGELLAFVNRYDKLLTLGLLALGTFAAIVFGVVTLKANSSDTPDEPPATYVYSNAPPGPLSIVGQAKQNGVKFWADEVTILPGSDTVRFRMRLENIGARPLTELVASASLPKLIVPISGECWLHRAGKCKGSISNGVRIPDLQPEEWTAIVFVAGVSDELSGGRHTLGLEASSEQTGGLLDKVVVVVSASDAENAVRPLFEEVEESLQPKAHRVEMAGGSKRLLISQWPQLTLEHPHAFSRIPHARASLEGVPIGVDDLPYDHRLDGWIVKLRGKVIERPLNDAVSGEVVGQRVEIGEPDEPERLRCYTTRQHHHLLEVGDEVEVKAIIVAWGPEESPFEGLAVAVCPAARVLKTSRQQEPG